MFPLHADGLPAGSGDTKFHPVPLRAAQSHLRHPCSAKNVVKLGPFRLIGVSPVVTGSPRFPLKTPLGFFRAEKGKSFPTKSRIEREYTN
ncbi:hypothetical protein TNCV_4039481 [Trichonephila clavipes]|nr:hypothetical protein TNCV_4039481 [Trichonephila clavipes]